MSEPRITLWLRNVHQVLLSYMPDRPVRRRPSFWEELGDYLLGELRAFGRIFALVLLALFLLSSLFLGMYQILRSLVLLLLTL